MLFLGGTPRLCIADWHTKTGSAFNEDGCEIFAVLDADQAIVDKVADAETLSDGWSPAIPAMIEIATSQQMPAVKLPAQLFCSECNSWVHSAGFVPACLRSYCSVPLAEPCYTPGLAAVKLSGPVCMQRWSRHSGHAAASPSSRTCCRGSFRTSE